MQATIQNRKSPAAFLLLLAVLACILAMAAVTSKVTPRSHAVSKHGPLVSFHARRCNLFNNIFQTWTSKGRGTYAEICDYNKLDRLSDDKTWSVRIVDKITGEEITVIKHIGDYGSLEAYLLRQMYIFLE